MSDNNNTSSSNNSNKNGNNSIIQLKLLTQFKNTLTKATQDIKDKDNALKKVTDNLEEKNASLHKNKVLSDNIIIRFPTRCGWADMGNKVDHKIL